MAEGLQDGGTISTCLQLVPLELDRRCFNRVDHSACNICTGKHKNCERRITQSIHNSLGNWKISWSAWFALNLGWLAFTRNKMRYEIRSWAICINSRYAFNLKTIVWTQSAALPMYLRYLRQKEPCLSTWSKQSPTWQSMAIYLRDLKVMLQHYLHLSTIFLRFFSTCFQWHSWAQLWLSSK